MLGILPGPLARLIALIGRLDERVHVLKLVLVLNLAKLDQLLLQPVLKVLPELAIIFETLDVFLQVKALFVLLGQHIRIHAQVFDDLA